MAAWQFAGDVPGLLSGGSRPPAVSQAGGRSVVTGGDGAAAVSLDVGVWELFWRSVVLAISFLLILPLPWVLVWYCRWFVSHVHVTQWPNLGFTGRPMDLWWYLAAFVLQLCGMLVENISFLVGPVLLVLYWLVDPVVHRKRQLERATALTEVRRHFLGLFRLERSVPCCRAHHYRHRLGERRMGTLGLPQYQRLAARDLFHRDRMGDFVADAGVRRRLAVSSFPFPGRRAGLQPGTFRNS